MRPRCDMLPCAAAWAIAFSVNPSSVRSALRVPDMSRKRPRLPPEPVTNGGARPKRTTTTFPALAYQTLARVAVRGEGMLGGGRHRVGNAGLASGGWGGVAWLFTGSAAVHTTPRLFIHKQRGCSRAAAVHGQRLSPRTVTDRSITSKKSRRLASHPRVTSKTLPVHLHESLGGMHTLVARGRV